MRKCVAPSSQTKKRKPVDQSHPPNNDVLVGKDTPFVKKARGSGIANAAPPMNSSDNVPPMKSGVTRLRRVSIKNMTDDDVDALAEFLRSRGLNMRSSTLATLDGGPSFSAGSPPPPTTVSSPDRRLAGSSHGNSPGTLSDASGSPGNSSVKSETSSSSSRSSSPAESDAEEESEDDENMETEAPSRTPGKERKKTRSSSSVDSDEESDSEGDEKEETEALSELKRYVLLSDPLGDGHRRNFDVHLDGVLARRYRFDLSHLRNLSPSETWSLAPSLDRTSGVRFDFLSAALSFSIPVRGTPTKILKEFCVHLLSETIDKRFRHLFSSMATFRDSGLLLFPAEAYNAFIKLVQIFHGVQWRNMEHHVVGTALSDTASRFGDLLLAASRQRYNQLRKNDFGGLSRPKTPCTIAAALHRKNRGLEYDRYFEGYLEEAAKFDVTKLR